MEQKEENQTPISYEVWLSIVNYLDIADRTTLALTCKFLSALENDQFLWRKDCEANGFIKENANEKIDYKKLFFNMASRHSIDSDRCYFTVGTTITLFTPVFGNLKKDWKWFYNLCLKIA